MHKGSYVQMCIISTWEVHQLLTKKYTTMKTTKKSNVMTGVLGIIFLTLSLSFAGCSKDEVTASDSTADNADAKAATINFTYVDLFMDVACNCIDSMPVEVLSQSEIDALLLMREEELLAHDVYFGLSEIYTKPVFLNISKSETAHSNAIKSLLDKYQLNDPAANHVTGIFSNPDLQSLYTALISQGSASLLDGLIVGATIEDLDIYDLEHLLTLVDNEDIKLVFSNLDRGSRNHLRSFYANILFNQGTYTPQYISQEEFDSIISSPHEPGNAGGTCN